LEKKVGPKVKKTHKPRYCEKEKDKANKRILRSLSFDNNGLVKPSCNNVAPVTDLRVSEHLGLYS
jgi:hypothetical protein